VSKGKVSSPGNVNYRKLSIIDINQGSLKGRSLVTCKWISTLRQATGGLGPLKEKKGGRSDFWGGSFNRVAAPVGGGVKKDKV